MAVAADERIGEGTFLLYGAHVGATAYSGASQIQITKA
jgi:hypothetical protein